MPQLLYTIEEYITENRKKDTLWIVFSTRYNEIFGFKKKPEGIDSISIYHKSFTDNNA